MVDTALSLALKEAMASAPTDSVILHTMELDHPSFTTPIRVVQNYSDIMARLEDSAPKNGGEIVKFTQFPFELSQPTINDRATPEASLTIDNCDRAIVENIELAVQSNQIIRATYRPYLSNDLMVPQYNPPLHLTLTDVVATNTKVSGRIRFRDLANKNFPAVKYTAANFPRLAD